MISDKADGSKPERKVKAERDKNSANFRPIFKLRTSLSFGKGVLTGGKAFI